MASHSFPHGHPCAGCCLPMTKGAPSRAPPKRREPSLADRPSASWENIFQKPHNARRETPFVPVEAIHSNVAKSTHSK